MPDVTTALATPSVAGYVISPSYPGDSAAPVQPVKNVQLQYGEDPGTGRTKTTQTGTPGSAITTNTSTLVKSGKVSLLGFWCNALGTSWTITLRDNPVAAAGGTTLMATLSGFSLGWNALPVDFAQGCVIDTAGTSPGSITPITT